MAQNKKADRAKKLIHELRGRTTERGFTEAEAMEAASKIDELLRANDLTLDEVGVREEAKEADSIHLFAADDYAGSIITGIGEFCTMIVFQERGKGHGIRYTLFGVESDREIAAYLYEICAEAMDNDWVDFMDKHGYSVKKRESFRMGFASRVSQRLKQMKAERDARTHRATGTALVVLKDQLVKSEFDKLGVKLRTGRSRQAADMNAYLEGLRAGEKVNLNNPLRGGESHEQITN